VFVLQNCKIQSNCTSTILTGMTQRGNITMIEELKQNERAITSADTNKAPPTLGGSETFICNGCLVACVDAAVKNKYFGGHWYVSDTLNEYVRERAIGSNTWEGSQYSGEVQIMYQLFNALSEIEYEWEIDECPVINPEVIINTDNKRLYNVLNRKVLRSVDMAQEAGTVIRKIADVRKTLVYNMKIKNVIKDSAQHDEFMLNSEQYMIYRCNSKAREERMRMTQILYNVKL